MHLLIGLLMLLGYTATLSPWVARNYILSGNFPVIGVGGGFSLWMGNRVQTDGKDYDQLSHEQELEMREEMHKIIGNGFAVDLKNDKKLYEEAIRNFIHYPKESAILLLKKTFLL